MANWTSYNDAANAGYSNIANEKEWGRTRNKMRYNSYQDYLNDMYSKFVRGNNATTPPTAPSGGAVANEDFSAKYRGDSYPDWFEANYGKNYDSTSGTPNFGELNDVDGDIGQSLYNYYSLGEKVDNQHKSAIETLDTSKRNSQQMASISLDKLKKYLPAQIKAQGLGGLGASESSMLQAYSNYNNQMGQIGSNYNNNKTTLEEAYGTNKTNLKVRANTESNNIYKDYLSKYESKKKEQQYMLNNDILDKIEQGYGYGYNSLDELKGYYGSIKDSLSSEQRKIIDDRISTIENSPTIKTEIENAEKEAKLNKIKTDDVVFNNNGGWWFLGKKDYSSGDNFSVKDADGKKYRIESGGEVSDSALKHAAADVGDGDTFGYQEKIYYKVGGKIYLIQKRHNSHKDDYNSLYKKYYG